MAKPLQKNISIDSWPELSTLQNPEIFSTRKVSALLDLISRIDRLTEPERDLLRLGVAAAAEELGYYRKDGRALRILRDTVEIERRRRLSVKTVVQGFWRTYEDDLRTIWKKCGQATSECTVLRGDGRAMLLSESSQVSPGQATLIAYSPPYLNHIDYTEVYKVELWLLGFITKRQDMLTLRKQTLRSHASIIFRADGVGLPTNVTEIIETAASTIEATGKEWHKHFRDTAFGYLQDIRQSLSRQYELLRPGGQAVCVVANSAHGSGSNRVPIAIDLLIAQIAQNIGFEAQRLSVARQMRRRDSLNRYLRETVLVLRRPES